MKDDTKIIKKKEKSLNRHWKNYLDKDYLGSHNLEAGEEMLLTIDKFVGEEMVKSTEGKESAKMVLYFKENNPKMILNITNANTISALYGSHPDGWAGKKIQVYATPVKAFGKTQDALRIRDFKPKEPINVTEIKKVLDGAKTLPELVSAWKSIGINAQENKEVEAYKNTLKEKLTLPKNENN